MTTYQGVTEELTSLLQLQSPPVGLAFVDGQPEGVQQSTDASPSTCAFWRRAEQAVFYADAAQHLNCQVGALVMGFELSDQTMQEIGGLVQTMCDCSYLSADEGDKIPSVGSRAAGVLYGPLSQFPATAAAVVLWLTPRQAMLFNEAAGASSWAAAPPRINGRPACAALPLALQGAQPALSLGCAGMRTFTEVADDRMLAVIPADRLNQFVDALRVTASANSAMLAYYEQRKAAVAGG